MPETIEHALFDCSMYEEHRYLLLREARDAQTLLISSQDRMDSGFAEFIRRVLQKRDTLLQNTL